MNQPDKLSDEKRGQALAWLERNWVGQKNCPVCGSNRWQVAEHLVMPNITTPKGDTLIGGGGYPCLMVISDPCGHVLFFNAVMAGLMDPPEPGAESE